MPAPNVSNFNEVSLGNILTIVTLLVSFWTAHVSNVRRIRRSAEEMQDIKTKVNMLYDWFNNNVVGRGEKPRRRSEGD